MAKDDWISAAMKDNRLVADLLVRLRHPLASSMLKPLPGRQTLPPSWGATQPRSKVLQYNSAEAAPTPPEKTKNGEGDSLTRLSPNTPLSWSQEASPSGNANGGCEESSRSPSQAGSKGSNHELACITTSSKRSRKKTFAQLKQEESILLNDNVYLKEVIAKLKNACKDSMKENESLKRMKVDYCSYHATSVSADESAGPASCPPQQRTASSPPQQRPSSLVKLSSCDESKATSGNQNEVFLLPDLNSPAMEEEYDDGAMRLVV